MSLSHWNRSLRLVRATPFAALMLATVATASDRFTMPITVMREQLICVSPPEVLCAANSVEEQERCAPCSKWETRYVPQKKTISIDLTKYRHGGGFGIPRGNFFLRDISEQLYDVRFPRTSAGYPITVDALYAHPERYGWTTVDPSLYKVGTIALDTNVGGLVVAENACNLSVEETIRLIELDATARAKAHGTYVAGKFLTAGVSTGLDATNTDFDADIVWSNGSFVSYPEPAGEQTTVTTSGLTLHTTGGALPMAEASMTVRPTRGKIHWNPTSTSPVMVYPSDENKGLIIPEATAEALDANRKHVAPVIAFGAQASSMPTPPPGPAPGGEQSILKAEEGDRSLYWNAWPEPYTVNPTFKTAPHLEPKQKYTLFIDLSGLAYSIVPSVGASGNVSTLAEEWILAEDVPNTTLSALIIADARLFTMDMISATTTMPVDRGKLKAWLEADPKKRKNVQPAEILDKDKKPFFTFGRIALPFFTHENEEGIGSISLSFWDATGRPVDELSIPLCVATKEHAARCAATPSLSDGFTGIDTIRTGNSAGRPTAALHFLDTRTGPVVGIFRRNDVPSDFIYWSTTIAADKLVQQLDGIMKAFPTKKTEAELEDLGAQLFALLFPDPEANRAPRIREARDAFETFLSQYMHRPAGKDAEITPSLFVRVLRDPTSMPRILPFGLLRPPRAQPDYLGYHFRIENPLDIQNYDTAATCVDRWFLVIPPESSELGEARLIFDQRLSAWSTQAQLTFERMRPLAVNRPTNDPMTFLEWVKTGEEQEPAALVVLSHHGIKDSFGNLTFGPDDYIASNELQRNFRKPAIAILNGCGTTQPGAEDVLTELNKRNVQTIIATKHTVASAMAVDFFSCLAESLNRHQQDAAHMGQLYFESTRCLRGKAPETRPPTKTPWGARSLAYSLLGNANLRLCSPTREARK